MKKRSLFTILSSTVAALAVIAPLGGGLHAMDTQVSAERQAINGRLIYQTEERDCRPAGDSQVCGFDIKWIALNDRGEVLTLTVLGSFHDRTATTDSLSPSEGHGIWTYPDGSTLLVRSDGAITTGEIGQHATAGTHTCIGGTGRFAEAECTIDWSHRVQPNGPATGSFNGTVTPRAPS